MNILHTSDLHGGYKKLLLALSSTNYDLWVDSGDFFPNKTRGDPNIEPAHQAKWFGYPSLGGRITEALAGRPMVSVGGNHDFVSLAKLLKSAGADAWDLSGGPVVLHGKTFAGFREIPWIQGEWAGETHKADFAPIVEKAMSANPDILVTHAPPAGILDDDGCGAFGHGFGIGALTTALTYGEHRVQAHLFGHIHAQGGKSIEELGVKFFNGSTGINLIPV